MPFAESNGKCQIIVIRKKILLVSIIWILTACNIVHSDLAEWEAAISSAKPLHWYKFDEKGSVCIDSGSGDLNGIYEDVTLGQNGLLGPGTAVGFERIGANRVNFTRTGFTYPMNLPSPWTVEYIFKTTKRPVGFDSQALHDSETTSIRLAGWTNLGEAGFTQYRVSDYRFRPERGLTIDDLVIQQDEWVHLVWRNNGSGMQLYFNGNLVGTSTHMIDLPRLTIGSRSTTNTDQLQGILDEAVVFDRALTDDEIFAHASTTSNAWNFTASPKTAYNPSPADGANCVDPNTMLNWTAGFNALLHTVYLSDTFEDVSNATGGTPQYATTFDPSMLELDKTYYWRVDEFERSRVGETNIIGEIWSFTTGLVPVEYYVSGIDGDDNNPGSQEFPFKTISKACDVIQSIDRPLPSGGLTIWIGNGTYRETVRPPSNATAETPLRFFALPGEEPIVSGSDILDISWEIHSGKIYRATTDLIFEQLFLDGQMMQEARWPNTPCRDLIRARYAICDDGTNDGILIDDALPDGDWNGAIAFIRAWDGRDYRPKQIQNYKPGESLEFTVPGWLDFPRETRSGDRFWLLGSLSSLDRATEWFLDVRAKNVYLWCPGNPDPSRHTVEVKQRKHAFDLVKCQHIRIEGLRIFAAGIRMEKSSYCIVNKCHFKFPVHKSPINLAPTSNYMTGNNNKWSNCAIAFSAENGIEDRGSYNEVTNCIIHDWDYNGTGKSGLRVTGAIGGEYAYNTICEGGGRGISAYIASYLHIRHNHIYNSGALTRESSALIWAGWTNPGGTTIAYNRVHDNLDKEDGDGISLELDTRDYSVHHNIVWNVSSAGLIVRPPSLYNEIYNNTILPSCKRAISVSTDSEDYRGTRFINNIANGPMNFTADTEFPEEYHNDYYTVDAKGWPTPDSGAVDSGMIIPDITDGYVGPAPDIGCFEVGTEAWQAGADWEETEFTRSIRNFEGFETGDFLEFDWIKSPQWMITSNEKNSGFYSVKCSGINNKHSTLEVMVKCYAGEITFYRKVSSEGAHVILELTIDGVSIGQWSGNLNWEQVSLPVTEGTHTFTWTYSKVDGDFTHNDAVWIDDIEFPIDSPKAVEEPCIRRVTNVEGFETGDFHQFGWIRPYGTGDSLWTVTSKDKNSGFYCAYSSASIEEETFLKVFLNCRAGNITFYRKTAASNQAGLRFDIDGERMGQWKGNLDWEQVSFPVTEGTHTFTWNQFRNPKSTTEVDFAWIDDIEFPIIAEPDSEEPPITHISNTEGFEL